MTHFSMPFAILALGEILTFFAALNGWEPVVVAVFALLAVGSFCLGASYVEAIEKLRWPLRLVPDDEASDD